MLRCRTLGGVIANRLIHHVADLVGGVQVLGDF